MNPNPIKNKPVPSPGILDVVIASTAAPEVPSISASERGKNIIERQLKDNKDILIAENATKIDDLAQRIAIETSSEELADESVRLAHKKIREYILSTLKNKLQAVYDRHQSKDDYALTKMNRKQSEYARFIAWRLRHGEKFKLTSPTTWLPLGGEIYENGFRNKAWAVGTGWMFWAKPTFYNPEPLGPLQQISVNNLVSQAVDEVSAGIYFSK